METTRITGPRARRARFSTGRAALVRCLLSPRVMLRDGLVDEHDLADLEAVLTGELDWALLSGKVTDAIALHVLIDPDVRTLGLDVLDDDELLQTVTLSVRAWLEHAASKGATDEEDEDEFVGDEDEADPEGSERGPDGELILATLDDLKGKLPESKTPGADD